MLKKLIEKILCMHKWNTYNESKTFEYSGAELPIYVTHTLICEKCGKIKKVNI